MNSPIGRKMLCRSVGRGQRGRCFKSLQHHRYLASAASGHTCHDTRLTSSGSCRRFFPGFYHHTTAVLVACDGLIWSAVLVSRCVLEWPIIASRSVWGDPGCGQVNATLAIEDMAWNGAEYGAAVNGANSSWRSRRVPCGIELQRTRGPIGCLIGS